MAVECRYDTFWPRLVAGIIDGLVFLPVTLSDNYLSSPSRNSAVLIAWALFSYPAYWVYSVSLHAYRGQTVGKKSERLKVIDISEERNPTLMQAVLRDVGAVVSSSICLVYFLSIVITHRYTQDLSANPPLPILVLGFANLFWFLLEIVTTLTNSKRRALHDFIAGTVVVRVDPQSVGAVLEPNSVRGSSNP